jgi:oxepin-CoA hydrolase/3-oxo-5,6-dehydrosuberyl-CoA semialdehyde dehydrogenase
MMTLKSHVLGEWHEASDGFVTLHDPCSEEPIARASSSGIDFHAALDFARRQGGPALRERTFAERAEWLQAMAKALHAHRDELIALSLKNTGTTRRDAKFDLDGATFTLSHYAELGRELGDRRVLLDGEGIQLGRSARFWGQHVRVPLEGCAVHINAFNFPAWGFAEKAACALLAGVPLITKPATSSALVTARCIELLVDEAILPPGALSLICGSTGDLLSRLGSTDVLAFTGSADTARKLRGLQNLLDSSTRVNIEADSLNAAVLGPAVDRDSETWSVFVRDLVREITQKTGQKCTAVRRILAPRESIDAVQEALVERLQEVVVGNPEDGSVTMGPLATERQLADAIDGVERLTAEARRVFGSGQRVDGVGNPPGKGYFFAPTLLSIDDSSGGDLVHRHEVFGPVATLLPYDGSAQEAAELVGRAGGSLVTSVYSNDSGFLGDYLARGGGANGRLYLGSDKVADQLPGSGLAMPHLLHGGPGRAGGGAELGGVRGMELYMQRVAVTGDRAVVERLVGSRVGG